MTESETTTESNEQQAKRPSRFIALRSSLAVALSTILMYSTVGVTAAQENVTDGSGDVGFCDVAYVGGLLNTGFELFIVGAFFVGLFTYVLTTFTDALPLPQETKKQIQKHKSSAIASMFKVLFVPAFAVVLFDAMGVVLPDCVNVIPF